MLWYVRSPALLRDLIYLFFLVSTGTCCIRRTNHGVKAEPVLA